MPRIRYQNILHTLLLNITLCLTCHYCLAYNSGELNKLRSLRWPLQRKPNFKIQLCDTQAFCDYSMLVTLYKISEVYFRSLGTNWFSCKGKELKIYCNTYAAKDVDDERCVVVLKTGCVNDRLKDMIFPKKDHENCNRTGKKKKQCIST